MQINRKTATKLLIVQWSRFQELCVNLKGSTLFTGVNGSGKSTILDAMTYLLTGNTQFNKAARDRDRTVLAYVRGDTKSNGPSRYLRTGEIISYIAMEFWSPADNYFLVAGVCVESANETSQKSSWFVCRNARIEQINFAKHEGKFLRISPRNELSVNGQSMKSADFFGRDRGVEQIMRALGLRCNPQKYRSKLLKMMAFHPENNIDQFIQECVLEPGKVESLKELREQRQRFEEIREVFENLKESKDRLEEVEQKSEEYENKLNALHIRELMLCYQELQEAEEEKRETELNIQSLAQKLNAFRERKKDMDQQYSDAGERCRIARNNDIFQGMQGTLSELKRQSEKLEQEFGQKEEKLSALKSLQIKLTELFPWIDQFFTISEEDKKRLCHLAEEHFQTEETIEAFVRFGELARRQDKAFETDEVHFNDQLEDLEARISELENKIKQLKANILVFPKEIEKARKVLQREFESEGIHTEVKIFAELVQEIQDDKWRGAIETFLGRKRFYIIVDEKYCRQAVKILQDKKIYGVNAVLSEQLPVTDVTPGSAAEILNIPNANARKYANYLLNGIHLCGSMEELHKYSKGGLMQNGMLAKSYAVSYMNISKTEFCLGQDAVKYQLLKAAEEKEKQLAKKEEVQKQKEQICRWREKLQQIDWQAEHYDFDSAQSLADISERNIRIRNDLEKISQNPDFMAVIQEQQEAEQEYKRLEQARDILIGDLKGCEKDLENLQIELEQLSGEIYVKDQEYSEKCLKHLELKQQMLEEYEKLREKKGICQVITPKTLRILRGEVEECVRQMENAQLSYCKLAEIDINKRGVPYIPFFREEYRNIANVKIEEVHQRLTEQSLKLENAFMNDFVAEINETIRDAKREIAAINQELKTLPFGKDTYKFVIKEKADREIFFRICRKLEHYMDTPEVYMNSAREDEEMERDIREFMELILEEEDETEYTDYRKYFVYDMEIASRQGDSEIISDLSKKQGSASNGEKQTPYFIILAASLLQCYPRQACCARLAFIDEAFSALSRERIEQMVKYLEDNHFQVFYAAPPEKINSIGTYIESTVSLVATGRYTNAVEGLVREEEAFAK
ncbi:SbcC/MukB-like Walker B domain-containing protein [Petralouisia muris]|uniref:SbcC/MukB-like Walker B domain-containing protein n=1 Tax=Petralouisia muris TaxID=3032872 RepID=UPI0014417C05|nr:SbcC/MukB-like Walker B domain-containing protein [Petralouisia muris]